MTATTPNESPSFVVLKQREENKVKRKCYAYCHSQIATNQATLTNAVSHN